MPIAQLISRLTPDPWRVEVGFSPEVEAANRVLLDPNTSESVTIEVLSDWIFNYQPCLFGRIAAKRGLITYCILKGEDLTASDERIAQKIQEARMQWNREALYGQKNAFIIVALSQAISSALPNSDVKELAKRLCSLYLQTEVNENRIYHDTLDLELPTSSRATLRWYVGVNYFCAQGDKRWWNDHRFPGGMAFSMNSVGHMVKSKKLAEAIETIQEVMGVSGEERVTSPVDSLEKALELAMRTIQKASVTTSGKATKLRPLPPNNDESSIPNCPVDLPSDLSDKDFREYSGYYHTDYTIPSEYFLPDVTRPENLCIHTLDFSYLFDHSIDNPDFTTMGEGRQVREELTNLENTQREEEKAFKQLKAQGKLISSSED